METGLNLSQSLEPNSSHMRTGGLLLENIIDMRWHELIFICFYLIFFLYFLRYLISYLKLEKNKVYFLVSFHYVFIIFSYIYSLFNVNDVDTYFQHGYLFATGEDEVISANYYVAALNYLLIYLLNLHYFTTFIFIGFFSSIGYVLLYASFSEILKNFKINKNYLLLFFLFPSWHFFTSFPGKDGILLFALGLYYFFLSKKKYFFLILPLVLVYLFRTHMVILLLGSTVFVWATYNFINKKNKLFYLIFFSLSFILIIFFINKLNPSYLDPLFNFLELGRFYRNLSILDTGWYSTGDNIFFNSFKYLLYPLYDLSSLTRIIISFENILFCLVFLIGMMNINKKLLFELLKKNEIIFALVFFICGVLILSNFTANIGISTRQKWMMMPSLILFITPLLSKFKFK